MSSQAGARALQRVDEYEERFVSKPRLELVEDPAPVAATPTAAPASVPGRRRTVRIDSNRTPQRRRPPASSRVASSPDRLALYALLLGLFLIFMAVVTASS